MLQISILNNDLTLDMNRPAYYFKCLVSVSLSVLSFALFASHSAAQIQASSESASAPLIKQAQRIRLSFESLSLPGDERMGLVGGFYDFMPSAEQGFYWGVGGYGAATGDRGGMFTLGMTAGYQAAYKALRLDVGLFVGAGGGASAFPGHGLQLRPHIALAWRHLLSVGDTRFTPKIEYSWVSFPQAFDGDWQLGLGLDIDFDLYRAALDASIHSAAVRANDDFGLRLSPVIMTYHADKNRKRRSNTSYEPVIGLAGLQIDYFINDYSYLGFHAYGAGVGGAGGYAKLAAVAGVQSPEFYNMSLESRVLLGMAGGGDVNTDGGLIAQPSMGLNIKLTDNFSVGGQIGRIYSLDALTSDNDGFSATVVELGIRYQLNILAHSSSLAWVDESLLTEQVEKVEEKVEDTHALAISEMAEINREESFEPAFSASKDKVEDTHVLAISEMAEINREESLEPAFSASKDKVEDTHVLAISETAEINREESFESAFSALKEWSFEPELLFRHYSLKDDQLDQNGRPMDSSIQLFGVGITQPLAYGLNVTGRTFWAGWGNVGAYAEGWFGVGYRYVFNDRYFINSNMALGVSGGGGMPVESGLLSELSAGVGYTLQHSEINIFNNLTLEFDVAFTQAENTDFSAVTSQLRWVYPVTFYWN